MLAGSEEARRAVSNLFPLHIDSDALAHCVSVAATLSLVFEFISGVDHIIERLVHIEVAPLLG